MASSLIDLLIALADAQCEVIVVGALAAVVQGAPMTTFDLDVVYRQTPLNIGRLIEVTSRLHTKYRQRPDLSPTPEILAHGGHNLLRTSLGHLDLLGAIEEGQRYEHLIAKSIHIELRGRPIWVLELAELLRLKRLSARPKDAAQVPLLQAALARRSAP